MMNLDETVVLRTYAGEALAHIAASCLGSEGIEAHIQKDDCGGAYPSLQMSGGVRLLVRPADLERAEKILDEMEAEDSGKVEQEEPEDRKEKKSGLILILRGGFLFLLGLAAGYLFVLRADNSKHVYGRGKGGLEIRQTRPQIPDEPDIV